MVIPMLSYSGGIYNYFFFFSVYSDSSTDMGDRSNRLFLVLLKNHKAIHPTFLHRKDNWKRISRSV